MNLASRIENLLFSNRTFILISFTVLTSGFAFYASQLRVDTSFTKLVPLQHPYMQNYLKYLEEFGSADRIAIALLAKDDNMFTPEYFAKLRQVTDAVFFLPGVDRTQVYSLVTPNTRYTEIVEDGLIGGSVVPASLELNSEGFDLVRENAIKAGIVGRLVANDFSGTLISARLQEFHPDTRERLDYFEVASELEKIRATAEDDNIDVHIIGFPMVVGEIKSGATRVVLFFGIAFLITAFFLFLYTNSLRLTVFPLLCSIVAVIWQLGATTALGFGIDPMSLLVPFLIFAIGVSHGVQMIGTMRLEVSDGATTFNAARGSFRRLLIPGAVALVSDTIGFLTIAFIEVKVIQEIALTASLGVASIILTNLILLPVLLSFLDTKSMRTQYASRLERSLQPFWAILARLAHRRPAAIVIMVITLVLLIFAYPLATQVKIGDQHQGVPELRPSSKYNIDSAEIIKHFDTGIDTLSVYTETKPDGCIDWNIMDTMNQFEWKIQNIEGVQSVSGMAGVARTVTAGLNEGNLKWKELSKNQYVLAQSVSFVPTTSGLLNSDCSVMPVIIYTTDHKASTIERIIGAVKEFQKNSTTGEIDFFLAGGNVGVMAATNEEVKESQFQILGYVFLSIAALCFISFRSLAATICIIVPLSIVSVFAYALMSHLQIGLKISTLPVVALGVGIGVDYGIYIYGRIRYFLKEGLNFAEAFEKTLASTGTGVALTGLTLGTGVGTWIFAPLAFQADMGTMLTFMFLVNMLGAIILLPAMGAWLIAKK